MAVALPHSPQSPHFTPQLVKTFPTSPCLALSKIRTPTLLYSTSLGPRVLKESGPRCGGSENVFIQVQFIQYIYTGPGWKHFQTHHTWGLIPSNPCILPVGYPTCSALCNQFMFFNRLKQQKIWSFYITDFHKCTWNVTSTIGRDHCITFVKRIIHFILN